MNRKALLQASCTELTLLTMLLPTLNLYNRTKEFFDHIVQLLLLSFSGFATTVWETTGAYMNSDELGFERSLLLSHTGQYTEVS